MATEAERLATGNTFARLESTIYFDSDRESFQEIGCGPEGTDGSQWFFLSVKIEGQHPLATSLLKIILEAVKEHAAGKLSA